MLHLLHAVIRYTATISNKLHLIIQYRPLDVDPGNLVQIKSSFVVSRIGELGNEVSIGVLLWKWELLVCIRGFVALLLGMML